MLLGVIKNILSPRQLVNLFLIGVDGQTLSGYGMSITLNYPKEKRAEILEEIFGGQNESANTGRELQG